MGMMDFIFGFGILSVIGLILSAIVSIFFFVFWIFMIVDCVKRKFKNDTERIVWLLVVIFAGIVGALIYYFVVKSKKGKRR
ncbi:MAG: PLDc N-terminal domain-containing protein [Candidatus Pacearchaeota archaeon]|nr:PLDc N-terminal domain-containing protein [Candidatus Pacearchaeota archaeon]